MTRNRILLLLQSALCILLVVMLAAAVIGIYRTGVAEKQENPLAWVYTREKVGAALKPIAPVFLLAAAVTAFAGPISFVGVAVPHLIKSLFGTAQPRRMIPACFLGGAVFCLGCDLLARMAFAPMELSISSVTAVFGAPVVIAILLRRQKR